MQKTRPCPLYYGIELHTVGAGLPGVIESPDPEEPDQIGSIPVSVVEQLINLLGGVQSELDIPEIPGFS